jgi:toxin-antitoxin system PIN domain toxin
MILIDVNVLVYAYREDSPNHPAFRNWLSDLINSGEPFGVAALALSGFLRITTHPKIFNPPSPPEDAWLFAEALLNQPTCSILMPGPRHWQIFRELCQTTRATGNLIPDAFFAAMAIEAECEWITTDGDFSLFPGLRWRRLLS